LCLIWLLVCCSNSGSLAVCLLFVIGSSPNATKFL